MKDYERLREARKGSNYDTAADAALCRGWNQVTYRAHENGQNGFNLSQARTYAKAFGVNVEWLVSGMGAAKKSGELDSDFEEFKGYYFAIEPAARKSLLDLARQLSAGFDRDA